MSYPKSNLVFTLSLGLLSPPYPLFQWYQEAFNAQGLRLIIVVVHLGAVKIYVSSVEALRKKERHDETQFTTKKVMVF